MPVKKKVEDTQKTKAATPVTKSAGGINLSLTVKELEHLRNLFSIIIPSEEEMTVSTMLATVTSKNTKFEQVLWNKITAACTEAGIDVGDSAPDFVVGTMAGIYQVDYDEGE
jgi:hypothetical protein